MSLEMDGSRPGEGKKKKKIFRHKQKYDEAKYGIKCKKHVIHLHIKCLEVIP